jgi:predicted ATPase
MITNISVDSFKSLQSFSLRLDPGLNILVGPNGSGKSNILNFFSFLSRLMGSSLPDAISRSGGAGAVFNKKGNETFSRRISCTVDGAVNLTKDDRLFPGSSPGVVYYKYDFVIEASPEFDTVYFLEQRILLHK